jgi:microcystin-dependent protein
LFAELGNAYGGVEADGTFAVPDFTGRFARNSDFVELEIGDTGGVAEVTLTTAQMPSHTHTDTGHVHTTGNSATALAVSPGELPVLVPNPIPATTGSASANLTNTGGGEAHNNLPPYLVITYYIQAK